MAKGDVEVTGFIQGKSVRNHGKISIDMWLACGVIVPKYIYQNLCYIDDMQDLKGQIKVLEEKNSGYMDTNMTLEEVSY